MVKKHLKRLAAPKTWKLPKKEYKFAIRPLPGPHKLEEGLPLNLVLKELMKLAKTTKEVKKILFDKEVLVDGKRRKEPRFIVGLMDVIEIPEIKEAHRVILNEKRKIELIPTKERDLKPCKIINKTRIGKQVQLNLHDGRNLLVKEGDYKTGDTIIISLPKQEIKQHLKLEKGALVYLTGGNHIGKQGIVEELKADQIVLKTKEKPIETLKKYAFVIGKEMSETLHVSKSQKVSLSDDAQKGIAFPTHAQKHRNSKGISSSQNSENFVESKISDEAAITLKERASDERDEKY